MRGGEPALAPAGGPENEPKWQLTLARRAPMLPAGAIAALIGGPILIHLLLMRRDGIAV